MATSKSPRRHTSAKMTSKLMNRPKSAKSRKATTKGKG